MEIIKDVAAIVGCLLSVISLVTIFSRSGRDFVKKMFLQNTKDLKDANDQQTKDITEIKSSLKSLTTQITTLEDTARQQCRNEIKDIYYKYCHIKKIPLYERKTADMVYTLYHDQYHGNSYASLLYEQIIEWEIDNTDPENFDE